MNLETRQEAALAVNHRWLLLANLRLCHVGASKVVVMPPIFFGRGYVFDGERQIISICRRLFGVPISRSEVRFADATLFLESVYASDRFLKTSPHDKQPPSDTVMSALVGLYHHGVFHTVAQFRSNEPAAIDFAAAISQLGIVFRKRCCHMGL